MNDEWHLQAYTDDQARVRVIMNETHETGPWFSRYIHTDAAGVLCVPDWAIPKGDQRVRLRDTSG